MKPFGPLTVGLALAGLLALLLVYGWVASAAPSPTDLDARVFDLAEAAELPGDPTVLWAFSRATDTAPLVVASAMVGLGVWLAGHVRASLLFWSVSTLSALSVSVLKRLADRSRPPFGATIESSAAWPSGHSAGSLVFALGVGLVVWQVHRHRYWLAAFALVPGALVVGYSRAALGLHWATDVIAGWLVALLAAVALAASFPEPGETPSRRRLAWLYGTSVAAVGYLVVVGVMGSRVH